MNAKRDYYRAVSAAAETFALWALKVPSYDPAPLRAVVAAWETDIASGYHVSQFSRGADCGQRAFDALYTEATAQVEKSHKALAGM